MTEGRLAPRGNAKGILCRAGLGLVLAMAAGCARSAPPPAAFTPRPAFTIALPTRAPTVLSPRTSTPEASVTQDGGATQSCQTHPGRLERVSYSSLNLGRPVPVIVFVPPCYDLAHRAYPVLYLIHGYPMDETEWVDLGAARLAADAMQAGLWPPFLIVMPRAPDPLFTRTDGGPHSYESEVLDGLVSFIDLAYRTDPRAQARGLAGISRGGVWALEIALRNPDVFDSVGALSPALEGNSPRAAYDPSVIARGSGPFPGRIFLAAGDRDWAREGTQAFEQLLSGRHVAHEYVTFHGGHEDAAWATTIEPLIRFLTAAWPPGL